MSKSVNFSGTQHVKFQLEKEEFENHHNELEINQINSHLYNINLGYLKVDHYYKVAFEIDLNMDELVYVKQKSSKHVSLKEMQSKHNGCFAFVFIFYANKEHSDEEIVSFSLPGSSSGSRDINDNIKIQMRFEAKVLGENQGTPALRTGVTLLHHNLNIGDSSEHFNFT
jgi:hypothetical protein